MMTIDVTASYGRNRVVNSSARSAYVLAAKSEEHATPEPRLGPIATSNHASGGKHPYSGVFSVKKQHAVQSPLLRHIGYMGALFCLMGAASAYPCKNHHSAVGFFINADASLYGTVYGLATDCAKVIVSCGRICQPVAGGSSQCRPKMCEHEYATHEARQDIDSAIALVQKCGFDEVLELPEFRQVPLVNPRLKANLGVMVSVNRLTSHEGAPQGIEPAIACLYDLA